MGSDPMVNWGMAEIHHFEGKVTEHALGTMIYIVLFLPPELYQVLPAPRTRANFTVNDVPFEGAWQSSKGRFYVMLSKKTLKLADARKGDKVSVTFELVETDEVSPPPELRELLLKKKTLSKNWERLTSGQKRTLIVPLEKAKSAAAKKKRIGFISRVLSAKDLFTVSFTTIIRREMKG